jgi:MFS transporter, ACS family, allantoate permease
VSNIIAPQFFLADQAPLYVLGFGAMMGSYVLAIFTIILYALYCWFENTRRDKKDSTGHQRVHADTDFRDMTDKQVRAPSLCEVRSMRGAHKLPEYSFPVCMG